MVAPGSSMVWAQRLLLYPGPTPHFWGGFQKNTPRRKGNDRESQNGWEKHPTGKNCATDHSTSSGVSSYSCEHTIAYSNQIQHPFVYRYLQPAHLYSSTLVESLGGEEALYVPRSGHDGWGQMFIGKLNILKRPWKQMGKAWKLQKSATCKIANGSLVGGFFNHGILWLSMTFPQYWELSSSQLTNSYFSDG